MTRQRLSKEDKQQIRDDMLNLFVESDGQCSKNHAESRVKIRMQQKYGSALTVFLLNLAIAFAWQLLKAWWNKKHSAQTIPRTWQADEPGFETDE